MSKISKIYKGWGSYLDDKPLSDEEKRRVSICDTCPNKKFSKTISVFVDDDIKEIEGYLCNVCKCPLSAKIRSDNSRCPVNKW